MPHVANNRIVLLAFFHEYAIIKVSFNLILRRSLSSRDEERIDFN